MLSGRALGSDHAEQDRDLGVVDGLELHAVGHDEQRSDLLLELRKRAVRDGDSLADARRLERFAFEENALDLLRCDAVVLAEHRSEERDGLVLVEFAAVRGVLDADALRRK